MNYHHDGRGKDVDLLLEIARHSQGNRPLVQQGLAHQAQQQPLAYTVEAYDSLLSPSHLSQVTHQRQRSRPVSRNSVPAAGLTNLLQSTEDQGASQLLAERLKHNLVSNVQRQAVPGVDLLDGDASNQQQIDSLIRNLTTNGPSLIGTSQAYLGHLGNLGQVDSLATELLHQQNQHVLMQQPQQASLHHPSLGLGLVPTSGARIDMVGGNGGKGMSEDVAVALSSSRTRRSGVDSPPLSGRKRVVEDVDLQQELLLGPRLSKRGSLGGGGRSVQNAVQSLGAYGNARDLYKSGQDELEAQLAEQVVRAQQQQPSQQQQVAQQQQHQQQLQQQQQQQQQQQLHQQQQQLHQQQQQSQQQSQQQQQQQHAPQASRSMHQEKNREAQRRFREKQKSLMEDLRQRVSTLEQRNAFLVEENDVLKRDNQQLQDDLRELRMQNAQLRVKIAK